MFVRYSFLQILWDSSWTLTDIIYFSARSPVTYRLLIYASRSSIVSFLIFSQFFPILKAIFCSIIMKICTLVVKTILRNGLAAIFDYSPQFSTGAGNVADTQDRYRYINSLK